MGFNAPIKVLIVPAHTSTHTIKCYVTHTVHIPTFNTSTNKRTQYSTIKYKS